jgi:dTDP-4-dehydrorhamnose 3,5-epimerase
MNFIPTNLSGCFVIEPKVFKDERGYFMESYNETTFNNGVGQKVHFVQDNQSYSSKGVLRGLHYQTGEHAQAKLVRVIEGEVLDIAVDIRPESETYGQSFSILLSAENNCLFPAGLRMVFWLQVQLLFSFTNAIIFIIKTAKAA